MPKIETTSKVSLKLPSRINLGRRGARVPPTLSPERAKSCVRRNVKPKQTFVMSVIEATYPYEKTFCWQEEKSKRKKERTEMKGGKSENIWNLSVCNF